MSQSPARRERRLCKKRAGHLPKAAGNGDWFCARCGADLTAETEDA